MRDYQRKKNNKYLLPRAVYHQSLWIIRDYNRVKQRLDYPETSRVSDINSYIRSNSISDPTFNQVASREKYLDYIRKVDEALECIPLEYAKGVWDNIIHHKPYPRDAHRSTYGRHKAKFVYEVAERFELL